MDKSVPVGRHKRSPRKSHRQVSLLVRRIAGSIGLAACAARLWSGEDAVPVLGLVDGTVDVISKRWSVAWHAGTSSIDIAGLAEELSWPKNLVWRVSDKLETLADGLMESLAEVDEPTEVEGEHPVATTIRKIHPHKDKDVSEVIGLLDIPIAEDRLEAVLEGLQGVEIW